MKIMKSYLTKHGYWGVLLTPCFPSAWYAGPYERGFRDEILTSDNSTSRWHRTYAAAECAVEAELARIRGE